MRFFSWLKHNWVRSVFPILFASMLIGCGDTPTGKSERSSNTFEFSRSSALPSDEGPLVAYVGATLFDGTGQASLENSVILVRGQKIISIGEGADIPPEAEVVNVQGKWIVPGLIDAHVHFMVSGRLYTRPSIIDLRHIVSYEEEVKWIEQRLPVTLQTMLCSGVTSVVSAGGPSIEYQARELAKKMPNAPSVFVSHGPAALIPEFMAKNMFPLFNGELTLKPVRSRKDARKFLSEADSYQSDLLKTAYDTGGSWLRKTLQSNYDEVHDELITGAASRGLKVTSHVHELEPARSLLKLGVDSLQHLPSDEEIDQSFVDLALQKEVLVVPTLALRERTFVNSYDKAYDMLPIENRCGDPEVIKSWFDVEELPDVGEDRIKRVVAGTTNAYRNTTALYESGVELAVGTDSGNFGMLHGASMHLELRELQIAGMRNADLISSSTLSSAKIAGIDTVYGSVEADKFADFLILSSNPLEDIGNLQLIDSVVKHGVMFKQSDLLPPPL